MKKSPFVVSLYVVTLLLLLTMSCDSFAAPNVNMMTNSSFEGGNVLYTIQSPFAITDNPANAHTGSWEMTANLARTYHNAFQSFDCWTETNYTSSIWFKGAGRVTFEVMDQDWRTIRGSIVLAATPSWQKASFVWNSGTSNSVMIMLDDNAGAGTMSLDDICTSLTAVQPIAFDGLHPEKSNPQFHLVFDDEFDSAKTIDLNNTGAPGYNWYLQSFFDSKYNANSHMFSVENGVLVLKDSGNSWGEVLDSAHPYKNSQGFIGTVFSGGSGLYCVARIALLNISSYGSKGWPGWWSNDMKGYAPAKREMPGNPGHTESIENDFMEYNPITWKWPANIWNSTLHDWCDGSSANLANSNAAIAAPVGTDFTQFHTYGMLWVPASAANHWLGYRQAYFDGEPQPAVLWKGNQTYQAGVFPETNRSMGSYLFSLMDHDQFQLILGSCQGGIPTMKVDYVRVYAVSKSSMTVVQP